MKILFILLLNCTLLLNSVQYAYSFAHYEDLADSTVLILVKVKEKRLFKDALIGSGAGVVVARPGYILTCKHVVEDALEIRVRFRSDFDKYYKAEVIKMSKYSDLALIRVIDDEEAATRPKVKFSSMIELSEDLYAIGHPRGHYWTITKGIASNLLISKDHQFTLQVDIPLTFGNSGGGVYNSNGELVGIASGLFNPFPKKLGNNIGNTGIAYVVPIPEIIKFYME